MRPLKRRMVPKKKLVKHFRKTAHKTKAANMQLAPQRGGWRL